MFGEDLYLQKQIPTVFSSLKAHDYLSINLVLCFKINLFVAAYIFLIVRI
jgi:hypothetical protein